VLLEKRIGFQLVKKFPEFYGTRRIIATGTNAHIEAYSLTVPQHNTFLRWGVVNTSPNPQAGGLPLVVCPRLIIYSPATLHIGGLSSIRNLRTRHAVVTGTHLSRENR